MGMLTRSVVLLEMKRLSSAGYNSSEAQLENSSTIPFTDKPSKGKMLDLYIRKPLFLCFLSVLFTIVKILTVFTVELLPTKLSSRNVFKTLIQM
jgi:hypothetical protein